MKGKCLIVIIVLFTLSIGADANRIHHWDGRSASCTVDVQLRVGQHAWIVPWKEKIQLDCPFDGKKISYNGPLARAWANFPALIFAEIQKYEGSKDIDWSLLVGFDEKSCNSKNLILDPCREAKIYGNLKGIVNPREILEAGDYSDQIVIVITICGRV